MPTTNVGANLTTCDGMLKKVYLKGNRRQFNLNAILLQSVLRKKQTTAAGKDFNVQLVYGRNGGEGWSSTGKEPSPGNVKSKWGSFNMKRFYKVLRVDGPVMDDAVAPEASADDPLRREMNDLTDGVRKSMNFQAFGDGTGSVATPTASTGATSITVASNAMAGLYEGQIVDVLIAASGNVGGGGTGLTISPNYNTGVVTITSGQLTNYVDVNASPSSYKIYMQGSRNDAMWGLQAIVSDANPSLGNYGGIDRTTDPWWQAQVKDAGNADPTWEMLADLVKIIKHRSPGMPNIMVCHDDVWNKLCATLVPTYRRFGPDDRKINGWATALYFPSGFGPDIPIVADQDCPRRSLFALNTDYLEFHQPYEGRWEDRDGAILRKVAGYDAYGATWKMVRQFVCTCCSAQGLLKNLLTS